MSFTLRQMQKAVDLILGTTFEDTAETKDEEGDAALCGALPDWAHCPLCCNTFTIASGASLTELWAHSRSTIADFWNCN